ncbi:histidine kinase dimerization/phosphoacceptor domain -containing protein [Pseudoroseomonas ludipueritiae]|uniref:histidine kinase n=1 Tax=Pseudoroseomonas ludipueritiae TaxID=198093 RepID=A0ABR7R2G9_9PROT|nr:histidine kinase dimerization/phosphoacceptor domain -containing protein [Pseudoroseomonas ludipueritiae]MBC9175872.1 GAF domain-containing protein [Pseudoroseomonas ludipueritiae]
MTMEAPPAAAASLDPVASQAAVVAQGRPLRFLALIAEAAAQLLAADDPSGMVDDLFRLIQTELRLDVFVNYRLTEAGLLKLEAHGGLTPAEVEAVATLELGQAICGRVAQNLKPCHAVAVQSSNDPTATFVRQVGLNAYACAPLVQGDQLLGTLSFGRRWAERFEEDELNFLHTICHYVALAKHRLRTEQELRHALAVQEGLLQELNHRVRNSLQLVIGVLAMEESDVPPECRAAIAGTRQRILVIASVHQRLYGKSRLNGIEIGGLLRDLASSAGNGPVPVECEIEGTCVLPVERAVALALIFDDLLRARLAAQPEGDLSPVRCALEQVPSNRLRLWLEGSAPAGTAGPPAQAAGRVLRALIHQLRARLTGHPARDARCLLELSVGERLDTA